VSRGIWCHPNNTGAAFGNASKLKGSSVDAMGVFRDIAIFEIDGVGVDAAGSACDWYGIKVVLCNAEGIKAGQNDAVWEAGSVNGCAREAWVVFGGSNRLLSCAGSFCGTDPTYKLGAAFRILNQGAQLTNCEGIDCDGPAAMVQADNCNLTGFNAIQSCNLTGTSALAPSGPRGGGYAAGKSAQRCAVLLHAAKNCKIDVLVRDRLVGTPQAPNLECMLQIRSGSSGNMVQISGDHGVLAPGKPVVNAAGSGGGNPVTTKLGMVVY
jgi:hypothetical protein